MGRIPSPPAPRPTGGGGGRHRGGHGRRVRVGDADLQRLLRAEAGLLEARLRSGTIEGTVTGAAPELAAAFAGPFVATCAVPAGDGSSMLVVDEHFASPACKPYADLGRR